MDFTLPPEIEDIRLRTRAFRRGARAAAGSRPANYDEHENIRLDVLRARAGQGQGRGPVGAAGAEGVRRHGAADRRLGRDVRGGEPLDLRAARVQLRGAGRRQHERARAVGTPAQKDKWLRPIVDGKVRSVLRHDRARARRRLRSRHDPDPRGEERRRLGDPRPQVVHHRRRRRRAFHPGRAHLGRSAARAHGVPLSPRPAGLAHRAPHPDHGAGGTWRPLRARIRRARSRRTRTC